MRVKLMNAEQKKSEKQVKTVKRYKEARIKEMKKEGKKVK